MNDNKDTQTEATVADKPTDNTVVAQVPTPTSLANYSFGDAMKQFQESKITVVETKMSQKKLVKQMREMMRKYSYSFRDGEEIAFFRNLRSSSNIRQYDEVEVSDEQQKIHQTKYYAGHDIYEFMDSNYFDEAKNLINFTEEQLSKMKELKKYYNDASDSVLPTLVYNKEKTLEISDTITEMLEQYQELDEKVKSEEERQADYRDYINLCKEIAAIAAMKPEDVK